MGFSLNQHNDQENGIIWLADINHGMWWMQLKMHTLREEEFAEGKSGHLSQKSCK